MARGVRSKTLSVLLVVPDDSVSLSSTYRFGIPRHVVGSLPAGILRLASAVKLSTPHRVVVHDARHGVDGNRGLRSVAKLVKPDLSLVWLHPSSLEGGLEASRALRQSEASVLVGTGPLIDLWPDGACRIPELDGLLPRLNPEGLCLALDVLSRAGSGSDFVAALASQDGELALPDPLERKLLDYAAYDRSADGMWPPLPRESGAVARLAAKGRVHRKAPAVSPVFLQNMQGQPIDPEQLIDDLRSCALLGIDWLDLCSVPGLPGPDTSFFVGLLSALARYRASAARTQHLRVILSVAQLKELGLQRLQAAGIRAVHLGSVNAGDIGLLSDAVELAQSCPRAGIFASGVLLLGCAGYDLEEDRRGVSAAIRAGFPQTAGVDVRLGSVDSDLWADWLDAPAIDFEPPGIDKERTALADRARTALESAARPTGGLRAAAREFFRT